MFDDLLGKDKETNEVDTESLIKALKYNVDQKQKMIDNLVKRVTELERLLESQEQGYV